MSEFAPPRTRHADSRGFSLELPTDWQVHVDPQPDLALVAIAPEPDPWGFRSNVVVTVERLDRGITLQSWQDGAEATLPEVLVDFLLIDRQDVYAGERAGICRLAHHDAGGRAITMQQWACLAERHGCTVTASVSTLAFPQLADELAAIGESFRFGPPA